MGVAATTAGLQKDLIEQLLQQQPTHETTTRKESHLWAKETTKRPTLQLNQSSRVEQPGVHARLCWARSTQQFEKI